METNYLDRIIKKYSTENFKMFLICVVATLFLVGADSAFELATDTYDTFCESDSWSWMLYGNGRIINAFVYYVIEDILHMSSSSTYILSYISSIFFLSMSIYLLSDTIKKYYDNTLCAVLISVLSIANIFLIEYFLFIEKGLFMFGILLTIMAAKHTINFFAEKKIKEIVMAELLSLCVVYIYQIFLGFYVILLLPFIIYFSSNILQFIKNNMTVALTYAFSMGMGLVTTKYLLSSSKLDTGVNYDVVNIIRRIWLVFCDSEDVIPKSIFAIATIAAVLWNFLVIKRKWIGLLQIVYIILGVTIVAFFPYFVGMTSNFTLRIMYPFASLIGVLILNATIISKSYIKFPQLVIIGFLSVYLLIQSHSFYSIFIDRYRCNQTDKYICSMIIDRINKYQLEYNTEISTICVYEDAQKTWAYDGLRTNWWLIPRAFIANWSDVNAINFYAGKFYQRGEQHEEIREYFASCNWDVFSDEQLIFDGQILHLCVY